MAKRYTYVVKLHGYGSYIVGGSDEVETAFADARKRLDGMGVRNFEGFRTYVHRDFDGALVSSRRP